MEGELIMPEMKIGVCVVGPIETNCYLIQNTETKEILVVDPGDSPAAIVRAVSETGGTVAAVLLTHGHHDHILGVAGLLEKCPAPVYACADEKEMLKSINSIWQDLGRRAAARGDNELAEKYYARVH